MSNYFKIKTKLIECCIPLQHKYALINGFSGRGKSTFIQEVDKVLKTGVGTIESSLPCVIQENVNQINSTVEADHIYLCDEEIAHNLLLQSQGVNCYCIIVTRKTYSDINMSHLCLYEASRCDDNVTRVIPRFILNSKISGDYDLIITEDSGAGFELFSKCLCRLKVTSAESRDKIPEKLRRSRSYKRILVIADAVGLAAVSVKIDHALGNLKRKGVTVDFCLPECFEQVLLCSEYLKFDRDVFKYFSCEFNNTEAFCEWLLELNTRGKPFYHNHNSSAKLFSKCWTTDCSDCADYTTCPYKIEGDKFEAALKDGPVSDLLNLR